MLTPESRRSDFPSLEGRAYLNTAAESIPPLAVREALLSYWEHKSLGMRGRDFHYAEFAAARAAAAAMLDRPAEEVAFCSCASEAYNLLASAVDWQPGDEVVVTDLEFPSGATPWLTIPGRPAVRLWENRGGVLDPADLQPLLNARTRLVQISLVSFLTGHRIDWAPVRDAVRALAPNAILSVDVTQAFGRVVLDCLDADCLIGSTYKWLLGIHGGCVVAVPDRITARAGGWYHLANAFDADRFTRAEPRPGAASFATGMPAFPAIYAVRASLDYLARTGIANIAAHADPLVARVHQGLSDLGIVPMSPAQPGNSSGIVSFRHPRDEEIQAALQAENVHVMRQAGRVRVAVHGYNVEEDVERLLGVLGRFA
jgi:cysteine desulfurase/selenocysteine lyase